MKALHSLPLLCLFVLGSCQSMSAGVLSVEARANILDDAEIDGGNLGSQDIDVEAYGLHGAFMTPIIDILAGLEQKEFGDEDNPELIVGARRRLLEIWRFHPFVEGNLRYGTGLDNGVDEEDYFGWQIGAGTLFDITDHIFLNARLMYESTEVDLAGGGTADVDGLVGTIGIGFAF